MAANSRKDVDAVAAAILSGTPIDWPAIEAGASDHDRELFEELRLLCTVADLHRDFSQTDTRAVPDDETPQYWGRLRLIERVGGGSFGDVYRAWDPRLRREVALKLITGVDAEGRSAAIIREGRLLARVRHPGVVTIYDAERIGSRVGLSMEFVEGRTLETRIREQGTFTADETIAIGIQLCDALTAAHEAGVIHRDVKAANVAIRGDGRIVLMDFGAGRHLDEDESREAGTPMYLAPEVLAGQESTVSSDVYSVGVLLHYMLTGGYPVAATSLSELRAAHAQRLGSTRDQPRSNVAGRLAGVLSRATDPHPARRPPTAAALATELHAVRAAATGHRTALMVAAVAALLAIPGWWFWARDDSGTPARTVAAAAGPLRIAVMPFRLTSDRPDTDLVSGGLAGDLISRLQTFDNARVVSADSSISVAALNLPLPEIARRLSVDALLTGTIERTGDHVRAEALLTREPGSLPTWSRRYEKPYARLAELQAEVAQDIARELGLIRGGTPQSWPTWNPDAHALHVKAQVQLDRMLPDARENALKMLQEAVKLDPAFAQAYATLTDVYLTANPASSGLAEDAPLRLATESAAQAMSLAPNLPASHLAAATIRSAQGDWAGADRAYQRALELGPADVAVRIHYAHWLSRLGRFEPAIEHARVAEQLDPFSARALMGVASVLRFARQWEASMTQTYRALEIDPGYEIAYHNLAHNLQGLGRIDEAIASFERYSGSLGNRGNAYAEAGRIADARRLVAELEQVYARRGTRAGEIAQIYCGLGEIDRAFEWLGRTKALGDPFPTTLLVAKVWDPLRTDPRFARLLERHRLDPASLSRR